MNNIIDKIKETIIDEIVEEGEKEIQEKVKQYESELRQKVYTKAVNAVSRIKFETSCETQTINIILTME